MGPGKKDFFLLPGSLESYSQPSSWEMFFVQHQEGYNMGHHSVSIRVNTSACNIALVNTQTMQGLAVQNCDLRFALDNL